MEYLEYMPFLLKGFLLTVQISILSLVISFFLGILFAYLYFSKSRFLKIISGAYTTIVRGIPELIWFLGLYYGLEYSFHWFFEEIISIDIPFDISPFFLSVFCMSFIFGAYMSETFRGVFLAVDSEQIEAAKSFGIYGYVFFVRIFIPQFIRYGISGFTNNWLVLMKTTALISVIGLEDVLNVAGRAGTSTNEPFYFYFIGAFFFLIYTSISLYFLNKIKNKYYF